MLQGYLRKLSSSSIIGRQWRSWYCEVLPDGMAYYSNVERTRAYGFVRLAAECKVVISNGEDGDIPFAFRIHDEQLCVSYRFAATNEEEMKRWVQSLRERIAANHGPTFGMLGRGRSTTTRPAELAERSHEQPARELELGLARGHQSHDSLGSQDSSSSEPQRAGVSTDAVAGVHAGGCEAPEPLQREGGESGQGAA